MSRLGADVQKASPTRSCEHDVRQEEGNAGYGGCYGQHVLPVCLYCPTLQITDMVSFYTLPSTVLGHPEHNELRAAYSFYTGACSIRDPCTCRCSWSCRHSS
jgi:hypothetical protein